MFIRVRNFSRAAVFNGATSSSRCVMHSSATQKSKTVQYATKISQPRKLRSWNTRGLGKQNSKGFCSRCQN